MTSTGSDTSDAAVSFSSRAIISDTGLAVTGTQKLQNSVVVNSSTQSILTNSSDGIAGLCWIRNSNVGANTMTSLDKLQQLYAASRIAALNADQHDALRKWAQELAEELKPKDKPDGQQEQA
jgi:CCR4-NOT transcriptional regulation complex NOT5 subunit